MTCDFFCVQFLNGQFDNKLTKSGVWALNKYALGTTCGFVYF